MPKTESYTNWLAFESARLNPSEIVCDGYRPIHPRNNGCHTRLLTKREFKKGEPLVDSHKSILDHLKHEHGGGFYFTLKPTDGKVWEGWAQLKASGVEIHDFRCDVCDKAVTLDPQYILEHLRPHPGKSRRPKPGGVFQLTLISQRPQAEPELSTAAA